MATTKEKQVWKVGPPSRIKKAKNKKMTDATAPAAPPDAEEAGPANAAATAAARPTPPLLAGPQLLALSAEEAAARWASLDDAALDAEVASYRTALEGVRAELTGLGRSVSLEDGQTGTIAGIEV